MKKVVFTFGRMNPPTSGHQLLVNKLMAYAKMHSGIPRVYLSHSIGKKDPLPYDIKVSFARKAFGAIVRKSPAKNIIQILKDLEKEKFTDVTLVVGSDRVQEFKKLLNTYNGKEYQFDNINVVSAGERDPDADDVSGMSASKMRALVKDNNLSSFMSGAPSTLKAIDRKNLFNSVRKFMLGEDVMDYSHDERFVSFMIEAAADDDNISMPSSEEIERYLESVSVEELDLADEDAFLYDVITGETDSDDVQENRVLSVQARQKLSQRMKFMSKRLARLRQIKSKTMPAQQRLRMRSRKAALMILRRRATGKQNLDYSALSRSQRVAVDNALVSRFGNGLNTAVDRISKRILPSIRKKAQASVAQARDVKEQTIDPRTKKIVPNQKSDSPLNVDALKLDNLSIDPTQNDRAAPNPEKSHLHKNRKLSHKVIFYEGRKSSTGQDARDAGDTNIIYQMRKTINSRGEHETEFTDGHKMQVSIADAKKLLARYEALRLPNDKLRFTVMAAASMKNFKGILAHGLPKEQKKKISLGGKKISEFYLGVGRNRTVSPYDGDEPPGTRRVAEASTGGVDPDENDDPNKSRKTNQKLDLLLRLGLADGSELQKYRRALRSSKKQALQSPEMRKKLADLLDKLIDLTTGDPTTFSRVRQRVMTKEAMSLLNKAEMSGVDVDIIFEVFSRGYNNNEDINEAFSRVNSFIAGGKAVDMDSDLSEKVDLPHKYRAGLSDKTAAARKAHFDRADKLSDSDPRAYEPAPGDATAKTKLSKHTIKFKKMYGEETIDESSDTGLAAKAKKSGISIGTLRKVYNRGMAAWNSGHRPGTTPQQWAMARVNSYIGKGKGTYHGADKDLREDSVDEACWDTHKQVGMKKKGNRMVPNCVPKEEHINEMPSVRSGSKGNLKGRLYDPNKLYHQTGYRLKSYRKPGETSKAQDKQTLDTLMKDFKGKVSVLPPGKKTAKAMIRPRDYMTPNQASKVGVTESSAFLRLKKNLRIMKIKIPKSLHEGETIKFNFIKARLEDEDYLNSSLLFNFMDMEYAGDNVRFLENLDKVVRLGQHDIRLITDDGEYMDIKYGSLLKYAYKGTRIVPLAGVPRPSIIGTGFIKDTPKAKLLSFSQKKSKSVNESQRTADIKMIKVRMPDGTIKFRKEKATTSVQHESYTGSEATSSNKNDPANRFVGTDEIRKNYASATPGQEQVAGEISVAAFSPEKQSYISPGVRRASNEVDQSKQKAGQKTLKSFREALSGIRESNDLNEAFSAGFELAPLASDYGIKVQSAFEHHPQVQESLDAQKQVANETVEEDKKGHRSPSGGLTQKGRDYYNRQSGGNLKAPVTTEPSKLKKGSKAANRRKSFCARMGGMKKRLTSAKTANDPDSRINKALRKWNC